MLPVNSYEYPEAQPTWDKNFPFVTIIEHPTHSLRFRYECERRCAGRILGENSVADRRTFPTIQIHGYKGPVVIVVSCVTRDNPPRPHPHSIMGKNSAANGIYSLKMNLVDGIVTFNHLGIQCMKKKQVASALEIRKRENVDPYGTGFDHMEFPDSIDLNSVRLCFQVFIQGPQKKFNIPLKPVVSNPIYDKKANEDLIICKLSVCSAPVSGGTEVILLCGKISRDDIQVRFFEVRNEWLFWEGFGEFQPVNVHKQVAIVFRTPAYCNQDISEPVGVQIQLRKKSDGSTSKPLPFIMLPVEISDTNIMKRKRARFDFSPKSFMLKQMEIQAEKRNAVVNQSLLLNFPTPKERSPIFHNSNFPENNNYATQDLNIHCDQTIHETFGTPVPQPRTSLIEPNPKEPKPKAPRKRATPRVRIQKTDVPPQPEPRRRLETPPPNVTIHSYAYCDTNPTLQWQDLDRYPRYSTHQQQQSTDVIDPFVNNLPSCDFAPRGPVAQPAFVEFENTRTHQLPDNSDTISDNLSKGLSISDEIHDTLQNIHELNRNVEESQQRITGKYMTNYVDNETNVNNSPWNDIMGQVYDNQPNENNFFS
ncbi:putative transcription factor p65 homolog [Leptopilina boulardi]|uniref:putative transcription factor p65 homolog n=1 Tax=Leptopilina boulardi TaxID=63433 RepID=UPI0021F51FDC|nr:putative transcription factor p65 homolog [Leptopilina boulardi]